LINSPVTEGRITNVRHQKVCVVQNRVISRHQPNNADTNPNALSSHSVAAITPTVRDRHPNQTRLSAMAEHKSVGEENVLALYVRSTIWKSAF